jgi:hypothetical protein
VAVPTVVPPLVHVDGAVACGPKTVKVIVPDAPLVALASVEPIEVAAIVVAAAPLAGPDALAVGLAFATVVEAIPLPHVLVEPLLLVSPP